MDLYDLLDVFVASLMGSGLVFSLALHTVRKLHTRTCLFWADKHELYRVAAAFAFIGRGDRLSRW